LYVLGIGTGADPSVISTCAIEAERHGYATLWSGEHVVRVDDGASRYPYADDGKIAVPAAADWLDPLMTLSYAAAVTSTIKLATGILLLPEHNPIVVAKPAASLDRLSRGRFVLDVGIGWSAEEFEALGVPFERRGPRTASYVAAMRALWAHDLASFESEFVSFSSIRVNPSPCRDRCLSSSVGTATALCEELRPVVTVGMASIWTGSTRLPIGWRRFGRCARGPWPESPRARSCCRTAQPTRSDLDGLVELGLSELVIVESPPGDPADVPAWIAELGGR
jgi:probable F420-dependent oxidoreductase